MKFSLGSTVFAILSINILISQASLAGSSPACEDFYKVTPKTSNSSSDSSFQFWPRPENAVLGANTSQIANLLAENSARQKHKGQRKVYSPELIGRELYTPATSPQGDRLYFAHKMLLGDLIKTDVYADAVVKVLAEDGIDSPEEIRRFVGNFHGWAKLNQQGSESFLARSAKEFATRLEDFVGENITYKNIDEAMDKYGLSVEDLIQLKSNLALFRENNNGNLKLSIMLPILEDAQLITKLFEDALARRNTPTVVPAKSMDVAIKTPGNQLGWGLRSVKNFGKKIFSGSQLRFRRLSSKNNEELIATAENLFDYSRSAYAADPNFLKNVFADIAKGKQFKFSEVSAIIKQAPIYFFLARNGKNRAGYTTVETHIRIHDFVEALSRMKLEDINLSSEHFVDLQLNLNKLKDLIFHTAEVFSREGFVLDTTLIDEILVANTPKQNAIWEKALSFKINQAKRQLTEFYLEIKSRDSIHGSSGAELEVINNTRANPVFTELFYRASREKAHVSPPELIDLMAGNKLSTQDVLFILRNFDANAYQTFWSLKGLYLVAKLPLFGGADVNQNFNVNDLKAVFLARVAMSFDTATQRLSLNEFAYIFDTIHSSGVAETLLGKAALAKFFKSVVGPNPSGYDSFALELNVTEAYAASLKKLSFDHAQFLQQSFDLVVDPIKATDTTSAIYKAQGTGTFTILNWIKGAQLKLARER